MTTAFNLGSAKADFLQLLVTQLRYQDPISPVQQETFIQQMATFSMVEGIESVKVKFDEMLRLQELTNGFQLVGQNVVYQTASGAEPRVGTVDGVVVNNGLLEALIGDQYVPLALIGGVMA